MLSLFFLLLVAVGHGPWAVGPAKGYWWPLAVGPAHWQAKLAMAS